MNNETRLTLTYFTVKLNLVSHAVVWGDLFIESEKKKIQQRMKMTESLCLYKTCTSLGYIY